MVLFQKCQFKAGPKIAVPHPDRATIPDAYLQKVNVFSFPRAHQTMLDVKIVEHFVDRQIIRAQHLVSKIIVISHIINIKKSRADKLHGFLAYVLGV